MNNHLLVFAIVCFFTISAYTQQNFTVPPALDARWYPVAEAASVANLQNDITTLAGFGTRHTLSDTVSNVRGIGAARRWIKAAFEQTSSQCGQCLEVRYHRSTVPANTNARIPHDVQIVNVLAIQRGTRFPNRYVIMCGDIDSRISDPNNGKDDSPGANDNASGMAGVLEAARVLSQYQFPVSIIYAGLSGEEQGLFGGKALAETAVAEGWDIVAVLNNDMIGNIAGINGIVDNTTFRVFSEATPATETEQQRVWHRFYGGEVDGPSRQLARYIDRITDLYFTNLDALPIYRLDRFGRGGHHRPFNDLGFAGVRIMETHEHYNRQHQDLRTEDGRQYGDVLEYVNFPYAAKLTGVNMVTLASLASAPASPSGLMIGGVVQASTQLQWEAVQDPNLAAYKVYWRETTASQWQNYRYYSPETTAVTLHNLMIDNYLFGVASVDKLGNESVVAYPITLIPQRR